MPFRFTKSDKRVLRAFIDGKNAIGEHLLSDGKRLDIMSFGGSGVARRTRTGKICIRDIGSKTGEQVGRVVKRATPKNRFAGWCKR